MKVALGVSGGIAAYKAAEICRALQERGLTVQVIMTEAAQQFVRPLTFAALSGQKVIAGMWAEEASAAGATGETPADAVRASAIEHIAVAQEIDVLLVAPATADVLAKFAHGMANDFLSTLYLATKAAVVIAPAMNVNMWEHPATQKNVETLRARGHAIVEPDAGYLACGMTGAGRLAENAAIVEAVLKALERRTQQKEQARRDLEGERVLVSVGSTREAIDPVRFIGNRSSGKMGFAIAEAARERGARVTVVAGVTTARVPEDVELVRVETAEEMRAAMMARLPEATAVIKTAAVADYRPRRAAEQKIKRKGAMTLELEPTADILAEIGRARKQQVVVGFAAETEDAVANARKKLEAKSVDAMVVNDVSQPGIGFDADENAVTIVTRDSADGIGRASKREVAERVLDALVRLLQQRKTTQARSVTR